MKELMTIQTQDGICSGINDGFALLDLARGWLKQGIPAVAVELLESAINSAEAERDEGLRARILKETGRAMMMQSDWGNSESHYLEAQRVFVRIGDLKGASECARNRANVNFQRGNYQEAADLCELALDWASDIGDHELRATIFNTLGAIKSTCGELGEAIKIFRLCLADFETSGNRIRQGYVLLNIGLTLTDLGDHGEALTNLNHSLAIALEEKDLNLVEICYQNISKCYLERNEVNLAKSVIETARKILPGLSSKALEAELNLLDGKALWAMGDFTKASSLIQETYKMAVENNLTALVADVLLEQGHQARAMGDLELAVAKLNAAADQYRQIGSEKSCEEAGRAADEAARVLNRKAG